MQEFYLSALGNRNSLVFNAEKKPVGDILSSSFFAVSSADANQDIFPLLVWQKKWSSEKSAGLDFGKKKSAPQKKITKSIEAQNDSDVCPFLTTAAVAWYTRRPQLLENTNGLLEASHSHILDEKLLYKFAIFHTPKLVPWD